MTDKTKIFSEEKSDNNNIYNNNNLLLNQQDDLNSKIESYNGTTDDYWEKQYNSTVETLNKLSELIAFINTYGKLYDKYYEAFIINLNNVSEHFLQSSNSKVIDELYALYYSLKKLKKSKEEIFEELRSVLYKLPAFEIVETSKRAKRRKNKTYSL